ncbi:MAG: phosphopantothenoylcysteine decarboxylase [Pseudomonadota bacterium]|nr:phosphopantothenoylcysteine decarboxylase [Pseudomonadota bacterium]
MTPLLLTAGATRNPVDAIRYLSAHATGRTGVDLAARLGASHAVHLLGSAEACLRAPTTLSTEEFTSTRDLMARMERWITAHPRGVLVHSAAVGDYEADAVATKIPSGAPELVLRLHPGPKIVDHVRTWAPDIFLVSFKAGAPGLTPDALEAIARAQLVRTGSDLVFANVIGAIETTVLLVGREGTTAFPRRSEALAALCARLPRDVEGAR